jgi:hypothetical protein
MARRSATKKRLNVNVEEVIFSIQHNRLKGVAEIVYNIYDEDKRQEGLRTKFGILSCWMNASTGNALKAYLVPNKRNPMHVKLIEHMQFLGVVSVGGGTGMSLTTDGQFLRYGIKPGSQLKHYDQENSIEVTVYDSKAKAIKQIVEGISHHKTVGGLNLVSFNRLPDTLLVETGYVRVDDLMKDRNKPRGIPMWMGNPDKAIGVTNEWRDREGAAATRQQFLDLLNGMLK